MIIIIIIIYYRRRHYDVTERYLRWLQRSPDDAVMSTAAAGCLVPHQQPRSSLLPSSSGIISTVDLLGQLARRLQNTELANRRTDDTLSLPADLFSSGIAAIDVSSLLTTCRSLLRTASLQLTLPHLPTAYLAEY